MSTHHGPEEHALVPVVPKRARRAGRPDRRTRPDAYYACSCGVPLPGNSRRQAKPAHRRHRKARTP